MWTRFLCVEVVGVGYCISGVLQLVIDLPFGRFFIQEDREVPSQRSVERLSVVQPSRDSDSESQLLHRRRLPAVHSFLI